LNNNKKRFKCYSKRKNSSEY